MDGAGRARRVIHFGEFELDDFARELRRQGTRLRLQDQPLQLLQILLQRPGEVVTREELQQKVWPSDTFVDFDHGINNAIKRLREAQEIPPTRHALSKRYRGAAIVSSGRLNRKRQDSVL
ncbi:MAG: winged helix-turn-helix domain-containing protein [Acidobacteriia bacterium]|nr:winged helix-turn-helix domain-containing protein [Terriglobia bacterium]